jgi:hypothetical protein
MSNPHDLLQTALMAFVSWCICQVKHVFLCEFCPKGQVFVSEAFLFSEALEPQALWFVNMLTMSAICVNLWLTTSERHGIQTISHSTKYHRTLSHKGKIGTKSHTIKFKQFFFFTF